MTEMTQVVDLALRYFGGPYTRHSQCTGYSASGIGQLIPQIKAAVRCDSSLQYLDGHAI